ncbi:unnamed protein product [Knipowitschia caucasica]
MASNAVEPMDVESDNAKVLEDEAEMKVSLMLPPSVDFKKFKRSMTMTLQTWANKNGVSSEFTVMEISEDGTSAVIRVRPAAALQELHRLNGQKLATKDKNFFSIDTWNISDESKRAEDDQSASPHLSSKHPEVPSDNDDSEKPHLVALGPYWYMKNCYQDQLQQIERANFVTITENVAVSIKGNKKNSNPEKASNDFAQLVQSCLSESSQSLSIPLKNIDPNEWKDTLKFLQTTDHKCHITISSNRIEIHGPQPFQTAIGKALQPVKITTNSTDDERMGGEYSRFRGKSFTEDRKTPSKIEITSSIKDPLVMEGLPVDDIFWEILTNQHQREFDQIKENFNVGFKAEDDRNGSKVIRVRSNRPERHTQMESHAIRGLLRLYQRVATMQILENNAEFGNVNDARFSVDEAKGASGNSETSGDGSGKERRERKQSNGKDKTIEKEEESCPICLDLFTKKTSLKCKHEFCKDCLDESMKNQGEICPVCKDVFGLVRGDQPDGTMTWFTSASSLPGYEQCGTIEIIYNIPSGIQTDKHPSPGRMYSSLHRRAYLPDNREGNEVLKLLKRAFDQKLIFTVGTSRTTGAENMVTWNDIHHKTSRNAGPEGFGYPDPKYLSRVKDELKAKGIK